MSTQMQLRGGTTAETLLFTGAQREVTVDTDKNTLVVHDGVTPGGFTVASEAQVADSTYFYVDDVGGGSASNAYILVPQANTNQPNSYQNGIILGFVTANANSGASTANFQGLGVKNIKYPGGIDPAPGDIFGRVTVIFDAGNDWLELQRKPSTAIPQIRVVGASVNSNAMTVSLQPGTIDFRSSSLTNGAVNSRTFTSALGLVIPSGASLGTTNGVQSSIAIIAIDAGGTVELAVVNTAGTAILDEMSLINTTTMTAAATSANAIYSTTARAGVPYRVVGVVVSTQAAAGTWSSPPTKVQGQGGQAIIGRQVAAVVDRAWQDLTASRVSATNYTNTTGREIEVSIRCATGTSSTLTVAGIIIVSFSMTGGGGSTLIGTVPNGAVYSATSSSISLWAELR